MDQKLTECGDVKAPTNVLALLDLLACASNMTLDSNEVETSQKQGIEGDTESVLKSDVAFQGPIRSKNLGMLQRAAAVWIDQ